MAVGTALLPGSSTFPGTGVYPGQGNRPYMVARISFNQASYKGNLAWVDVSDRLRSFGISRGGENELELIDTGTCQVILDNRDRALDPFNTSSVYSPNVKPRRRLWLQSQWAGETIDQFYGWTGAFKPEWPGQGADALVSLNAQDAFAILSGDALPTTSPPRDSYADLVAFDNPVVHLRFDESYPTTQLENQGTQGNAVVKKSGTTSLPFSSGQYQADGAIVGDPSTALSFISTDKVVATDVGFSEAEFTVEAWITHGNTTDATIYDATGGTADLRFVSNALRFTAQGSVLTSTTTFTVGTAYHVVGTYSGTTARLYINGVEEDSSSPVPSGLGGDFTLGAINLVATIDELAIYQSALSAARISEHYSAATEMGRDEEPVDDRLAALMEQSGLGFVPRRLRTAGRNVAPTYYHGQDPRSEIEQATRAEGDPALTYIAKDGALVFLDRDHRTVSPWNTVQATFDDDGTDNPYLGLEIDDGEAFIYNDVRVTARGGELQKSTDSASIAEYQRRVLDRGETLNVSDSDASDEADALLAKYKDPLARITALTLAGSDEDVLSALLTGELGDCIRVFRRPLGGGSAIDQTSFIRKIDLSGSSADIYWTCTWAVAKR